MHLRLFLVTFATFCLLAAVPAFASASEPDPITSIEEQVLQENTASTDVFNVEGPVDSDSGANDDTPLVDPEDPNGPDNPKGDDDTSVHPVDEAPQTVEGGKAELTKSETTTQTTKIEKVDMYRMYNPNSGEHFYTSSTHERDQLRSVGWNYEGIGWMAPAKSNYPVYRLYNPNAGDHHYTLSTYERDQLKSMGWNYEGIGWYSAASSEGIAVFRQYNPNATTGTHNFTTSSVENLNLVNVGWKAEGIAWYALASDVKTTQSTKTTLLETAPYLTATFTAQGNAAAESVVSYAQGNETYLFLPSYAPLDNIYISALTARNELSSLFISGSGSFVNVDPRTPLNLLSLGAASDANGAIKLKFKSSDTGNAFPLIIMRSANVATMYLNSNNVATQGRKYVEASPDHSAKANVVVRLIDSTGGVIYDADAFDDKKHLSTVKGRGNSSWNNGIKKPYQISLSSKTDLMGDSAPAKKWILLANSADATLLHSSVAFNLAAELGLGTVSVRPVDLYYDGDYRGSYLLAEKIGIGSGRVDIYNLEKAIEEANSGVDIEKLPTARARNSFGNEFQYVSSVKDPANITGGYLIELDNGYYASELCWFTAIWPGDGNLVHFVLKSPEVASKNAVAFISQAVQQALNNLSHDRLANGSALSDGSFAFDLDSFAKMYLLEEFLKNNDTYTSSTYFYLDQNSKIIMSGPVWDFDAGMGTRIDAHDSLQSTYWGFYLYTHNTLLSPSVKNRVQFIWNNTMRNLVKNVILGNASALGPLGKLHSITFYSDEVAASQRMNEVPFGVTSFGFQAEPFATWKLNIDFFKNWITWRLQWFDRNAGDLYGTNVSGQIKANRWHNDFDYGYVFDYQYYLDQNPDLRAAGITTPERALWHFVTYGIHESSRIGKTSRNFNVKAYMEKNPDLRFGNDLATYYMHYCSEGFKKGLVCWY